MSGDARGQAQDHQSEGRTLQRREESSFPEEAVAAADDSSCSRERCRQSRPGPPHRHRRRRALSRHRLRGHSGRGVEPKGPTPATEERHWDWLFRSLGDPGPPTRAAVSFAAGFSIAWNQGSATIIKTAEEPSYQCKLHPAVANDSIAHSHH